jgi:hypothetical protein
VSLLFFTRHKHDVQSTIENSSGRLVARSRCPDATDIPTAPASRENGTKVTRFNTCWFGERPFGMDRVPRVSLYGIVGSNRFPWTNLTLHALLSD